MDNLPTDLIIVISNFIPNYYDVFSLKKINKNFNNSINNYQIIKKKMEKKLKKYKKTLTCINNNCYHENKHIIFDFYRENDNVYTIRTLPSINNDTIYINLNSYNVSSPYCCECFKKYVLFGDLSEEYFRNIIVEGFIDVEFTHAKDRLIPKINTIMI